MSSFYNNKRTHNHPIMISFLLAICLFGMAYGNNEQNCNKLCYVDDDDTKAMQCNNNEERT